MESLDLPESTVDHPLVSGRLFFPRHANLWPNLVVDMGGAELACYLHDRHPRAGVVVHFHGNGELAAEYSARRVVAFRRSLGSLYAVELIARLPGVVGLVIDSGIADLPQ